MAPPFTSFACNVPLSSVQNALFTHKGAMNAYATTLFDCFLPPYLHLLCRNEVPLLYCSRIGSPTCRFVFEVRDYFTKSVSSHAASSFSKKQSSAWVIDLTLKGSSFHIPFKIAKIPPPGRNLSRMRNTGLGCSIKCPSSEAQNISLETTLQGCNNILH